MIMREHADLARIIEEVRQSRLLLVGEFEPAQRERSPCDVTVLSLAEAVTLPFSQPFDMAIVRQPEAAIDQAALRVLLAALRDVYARRVLVLTPMGSSLDLNALGFTRLTEYTDSMLRLYGFELKTYKSTPDWLSPQYWANPEMWDKKRW